MEQLINTLLTNAQMPQMTGTAKKGEAAQQDGFQKLLEQKQNTDGQPVSKQEKPDAPQKAQSSSQSAEKPQEAEQAQQVQDAQEDPRELENQMALAAMLMMQNPVVPVEQVEIVPEAQAEVVVQEIAPVVEEAVLAPEVLEAAPETKTAVEIPVESEETQTVDQALTEELPQTIEAPEAAKETEGRTVEIKVENGHAEVQAVEESDTEETNEPQGAEVETHVFEDVKAVPVKVGEAPRAEKAEQPVEQQIAPKVTEALASGDTRVEIQLTPENLGKITVEMTLDKSGNLTVQLHAQNKETQNLLGKNVNSLAELLGREMEQEVRVEVPRQEESQRQDLYEQQQEQQKRHQQEQNRKKEAATGEDFLQQLRLGLIPLDEG